MVHWGVGDAGGFAQNHSFGGWCRYGLESLEQGSLLNAILDFCRHYDPPADTQPQNDKGNLKLVTPRSTTLQRWTLVLFLGITLEANCVRGNFELHRVTVESRFPPSRSHHVDVELYLLYLETSPDGYRLCSIEVL